jgi:hypothetical protein
MSARSIAERQPGGRYAAYRTASAAELTREKVSAP